MTKETIFKTLQKYGCVAVYVTGSSIIPFISYPRDIEYYAIFTDKKSCVLAPYIYNVHNYVENYYQEKVQLWSFLFHYLNNSQHYVGRKCHFNEVTLEKLQVAANTYKSQVSHTKKTKTWYRVAIIDAILKYGYDSIPEYIIELINALHTCTITFAEYERRLNLCQKNYSSH